jgi:hypothetical protein
VVRQESLQQDLNDLEAYLGGSSTRTNVEWHPADMIHFATRRVSSSLSAESTRMLCCALQQELAIYQTLIERAENLSNEAKQQSISAAYQSCGESTSWQELQCNE